MGISNQDKITEKAFYSLLSLIQKHRSVSQVQLSELSGYSRSTVSVNCDKLLSDGYVICDSSGSPNKRKNHEFRLNNKLGSVIGIGLGRTSCRIALFDIEGNLLEKSRIPAELSCGPEPLLEKVCAEINGLIKNRTGARLLGIGMGLPSPVKYHEGMAFHPATMPGWHMFPLKEYFKNWYHCPVFIENEVNTMALGEYAALKSRQINSLLCIKAGTGIGAGIIMDGGIYRGENGGGGGIGHIRIDHDKTACSCGKQGCLEALAGAVAVEQQAEKARILKTKRRVSLDDLRRAAEKGDKASLGIIRNAAAVLGTLVGKLIIFIDPAMVVISGRLTALGPIYLDYIRKAILKEAAPWIDASFPIEFSRLKADGIAAGAALLCIGELFERQLIAVEK
jgi:predicted NBD/HSP70 family sugar kinase